MDKKAFHVLIFAAGFIAALISPRAFAATLSFFPQSGTYFSGRSFTVAVQVASPNQAMNAVQGEISFPTKKLQVLSVSNVDSVLNLWVQSPTFSNQDGTIDFSGVVVNPGYQGTATNVITITFVAKNTGVAPLTFVSASVLANDGKGTNILDGMPEANFTIMPLANAASGGNIIPSGAAITTVPFIADGQWYNINKITFDWSVPSSADGVDYEISNNPAYQQSDVNRGMVSQTTYDLSSFIDGKWYFYLSFESGNSWSPAIRKTVMIDRAPPDPFTITRVDADPANPEPIFTWAANDPVSGISRYEVKIGNGNWFDPSSIETVSSTYVLPPQSPTATRTLVVRAFDGAGNYRDATVTFSVLSPSPNSASGIVCPSKWLWLSCGVWGFFVQWGWLVSIIAIISLMIAYLFIYKLLRWKSVMQDDLQRFKNELETDIAKFGTGDGMEAPPLEKQATHVVEDVNKEIQHLDENP